MKPEDIDVVINNLRSVLPLATKANNLDMSQPCVKFPDEPCGTVLCVGGWYAVANINRLSQDQYISFAHGADLMAIDLGLPNHIRLMGWAKSNPDIWGNEFGQDMFACAAAYGYNTKTLADVVLHWEGVRQRVIDYD